MQRGLLAYWIYSCCASGAVSYKVTEGATACNEMRIPSWTKPELKFLDHISGDACEYSFRSPDGSVIFLGLICNAVYYGRSREKYALDPSYPGGARSLSESEWEAATPVWPSQYGPDARPPSGAIEYLGHMFPKTGPNWPTIPPQSSLSQGTRIAVYSWDGVIKTCSAGPFNCWIWDDHYRGDYWIDLFDVPSATKLIQIRGEFDGVDATRMLQAKSAWPNSRYFVVPLDPKGMRRLLACDVDTSAAGHGIVTDRSSVPKTSLRPHPFEIQDEPLGARFTGMRSKSVVDNDSKVASLDFDISLNVRVARRYRLVIGLCTGPGPCLVPGVAQPKYVEQQVEADLDPGPSQIKLRFTAEALRVLGTSGPYNIGRITVTHAIKEGRGLDYDRFEAGQTLSPDFKLHQP